LRTETGISRFWMTFASSVTFGIGSLNIPMVRTGSTRPGDYEV
jgi:hypothetical protein